MNRMRWIVIGCCLTCISVSTARSQQPQRRIPVRRYQSAIAPRDRIKQGPVQEVPGEVTSIEIRNEAGEIVDGELGEDEYFYGAAPVPVNVGDPVPKFSEVPARTAGMRLGQPTIAATPGHIDGSHAEMVVLGDAGTGDSVCDNCGNCDSCAPGGITYHDARLEKIARILANPMAGFWVRAEYLHLWMNGQQAPPLVTTSLDGTARDDAGVLGLASTTTLYGGNEIGDNDRSAGRIEIGRYLGVVDGLAISASYLFTDDVTDRFSAGVGDFAILGRPFIDVSPGGVGQNAELASFPNELAGNVDVMARTSFAAADVLLRGVLICERDRQMEGFVGYTYLNLDDDLTISDSKRVIGGGGGLVVGTTLDELDAFSTANDFHGAALGVRSQTCYGGWSIATMLKLGLGSTRSQWTARGATTTSVPLAAGGSDVVTRNTGLLVQDSNRGSRSRNEFSVAPELRLLVSRRMNQDWSVNVGYHLLYWSRVLRAGQQIDPMLNLTQLDAGGLQGLALPGNDAVYDDLTVQAITFGLLREF